MDTALDHVGNVKALLLQVTKDDSLTGNEAVLSQLSIALSVMGDLETILSNQTSGKKDDSTEEAEATQTVLEKNLSNLKEDEFDKILDQVSANDTPQAPDGTDGTTTISLASQTSADATSPKSTTSSQGSRFSFKPQGNMFANMKRKLKAKGKPKEKSFLQLSLDSMANEENDESGDSGKPMLNSQASLSSVHGADQVEIPEEETKVFAGTMMEGTVKVGELKYKYIRLIYARWRSIVDRKSFKDELLGNKHNRKTWYLYARTHADFFYTPFNLDNIVKDYVNNESETTFGKLASEAKVIMAGASVSKAAGSLMVRVNPERKQIKSPKSVRAGATPLATVSDQKVTNRNKIDNWPIVYELFYNGLRNKFKHCNFQYRNYHVLLSNGRKLNPTEIDKIHDDQGSGIDFLKFFKNEWNIMLSQQSSVRPENKDATIITQASLGGAGISAVRDKVKDTGNIYDVNSLNTLQPLEIQSSGIDNAELTRDIPSYRDFSALYPWPEGVINSEEWQLILDIFVGWPNDNLTTHIKGIRTEDKGLKDMDLNYYFHNYVVVRLALFASIPNDMVYDIGMKLSFVRKYLSKRIEKEMDKLKPNTKEERFRIEGEVRQDVRRKIINLRNSNFFQILFEYSLVNAIHTSRTEVEAIQYYLAFHEDCTLPNNFLSTTAKGMKTLLHKAANRGWLHLTKILLKHGSDISEFGQDGLNSAIYRDAESNVKEYLYRVISGDMNRGKEKIETQYWSLRRQNSILELFLKYLGYIRPKKSDNIENDAIEPILSFEDASKVVEGIQKTVLKLLEQRRPISDTMLILSIMTANMSKDKDQTYAIWNVLEDAVTKALDHDGPCKERDYHWFKTFLLNSNCWFHKLGIGLNEPTKPETDDIKEDETTDDSKDTKDSKDSKKSGKSSKNSKDSKKDKKEKKKLARKMRSLTLSNDSVLIFNRMQISIDKLLETQKEFIRSGIEKELKENPQDWANILNFKEFLVCSAERGHSLRQDYLIDEDTGENIMKKGIYSTFHENKLYLVSAGTKAFDAHEHYELNGYLSKMMMNAHTLNEPFQQSIRHIFDIGHEAKQYETENDTDPGIDVEKRKHRSEKYHVLYQKAPVKLTERCMVKAQTDYSDKPFPTTAQIVDIIRCSLTFDSAKDMIDGLNRFIRYVIDGKAGYITKVVRVKNMFSKLKEVETTGNYSYCDIKLNVITEYNNISIIGEVQFMIKWMLDAKIMGHSLYMVKRRQEFVDNVMFMMKNDHHSRSVALLHDAEDTSVDSTKKWENKMFSHIDSKNFSRLANELLYDPFVTLDIGLSRVFPMLVGQGMPVAGTYNDYSGGTMRTKHTRILSYAIQKSWYKGVKYIHGSIGHCQQILDAFVANQAKTTKKSSKPTHTQQDSASGTSLIKLTKSTKDKLNNYAQNLLFSMGDSVEIEKDSIFIHGIASGAFEQNPQYWKILKYLMKSPFFKINDFHVLGGLIMSDAYYIAREVLNNRSNDPGVQDAINKFFNSEKNGTKKPLEYVVSVPTPKQEKWIRLLLSQPNIDVSIVNASTHNVGKQSKVAKIFEECGYPIEFDQNKDENANETEKTEDKE